MARRPPKPIVDVPHAVLYGNLYDGFSLTGPFPNKAEAEAWARDQERYGAGNDRWFATELNDPNK